MQKINDKMKIMILDQKSLGSRPNRTTKNQPLTIQFAGGFLFLANDITIGLRFM